MQTWIPVNAQCGRDTFPGGSSLESILLGSTKARQPQYLPPVQLRSQVACQGVAPCLGALFLEKEWPEVVSPSMFGAPSEGKCLPLSKGQVLLSNPLLSVSIWKQGWFQAWKEWWKRWKGGWGKESWFCPLTFYRIESYKGPLSVCLPDVTRTRTMCLVRRVQSCVSLVY